MPFQLLHTVKTTYENDCYILDGCLCSSSANHNSQPLLALSASNHTIRLYDVHSATFVCAMNEHTESITDLISNWQISGSSSLSSHLNNCLLSSQSDGGVMVSDISMGRGVHFLHCNEEIREINPNINGMCNSLALSPSSNILAVSLGGEVVFYDTRMWKIINSTFQLHNDEVARIRFLDDTTLCSSSEDQMVLFTNVAHYTKRSSNRTGSTNNSDEDDDDDDDLLQAISVGEVMTKINCFPALQCVAMIGSCENGHVCPYNLETREQKVNRPNEFTYLVDWCTLQTQPNTHAIQQEEEQQLMLVMGTRDEDGNAGTLQIMDYQTGHVEQLPRVHSEIARIAVGFHDRLITGAEDGMLAFWQYSPHLTQESSSQQVQNQLLQSLSYESHDTTVYSKVQNAQSSKHQSNNSRKERVNAETVSITEQKTQHGTSRKTKNKNNNNNNTSLQHINYRSNTNNKSNNCNSNSRKQSNLLYKPYEQLEEIHSINIDLKR